MSLPRVSMTPPWQSTTPNWMMQDVYKRQHQYRCPNNRLIVVLGKYCSRDRRRLSHHSLKEMFSSNPQVQEQWSIMIFPIGLPPNESSRCQTFVSPRRTRMWRTTTSCVSTQKDSPAIHTPSPGAVCPAIVTVSYTHLFSFFYG